MKKIMTYRVVLFLILFIASFAQLNIASAVDSYLVAENGITINDMREKRGGTPNAIQGSSADRSFIKNTLIIITEQKVQLALNILLITVIIILGAYIKRKSKSREDDSSDQRLTVSIEGNINEKKNIIAQEGTSLIEIVEKFFFPFFRRNIEKINIQVDNFSDRFDKQTLIHNEIMQSVQNQLLRNSEIMLNTQSQNLNEIYAMRKLFLERIDTLSSHIEDNKKFLYGSFAISSNMKLTETIPTSYEDFLKYCEASLSIENEFNLFNQIPIEYYTKKITDKNIVAYGNCANLLVKHLGFGRSFKHSFLDSVSVTINDEKRVPLSLLPDNIGKIESMVITNPHLAMALITADNLLERVKDSISETIIFPIEINVPLFETEFQEFGGIENNDRGLYRWAVGFEKKSVIKIYNNSNSIKNVDVSFSVTPATVGSYFVFNNEKILLDKSNVEIAMKIDLTDGENILELGFSGEKVKIGNDPRELRFAVYNFSINGNLIMNNLALSSKDYDIRKRLHSVGFFEIESELVTNRGFYVKKLPVSKFTQMPLKFFDMLPVIENLRLYATTLGTNKIIILYKCFRKECSDEN